MSYIKRNIKDIMEFQRCSRCVMDNESDPYVTFDENGLCSYCREAFKRKAIVYFPNEDGRSKLKKLLSKLKREGQGKDYDCMMGISGGLDSSYLAMLGYRWGLRILGVHIDDGFDTEIAKKNIENLSQACHIKLITIKPDADQFNALTKAFIFAESVSLDIPQDNILFATLHNYAKKHSIKYFLSGGNFALESILQKSSNTNTFDKKRIERINNRYGELPINKLDIMSNYQRITDRYIHKFHSVRPLNYIDYNQTRAIEELKQFCGFRFYEAKHCENYLTKIIQLYWMPRKFGFDKRKSHFSSLIVTNQISRDTALKELETKAFQVPNMEHDLNLVLSILGINKATFDQIILKKGNLFTEGNTSIGYKIARKYFNDFLVKFKG